MFKILIVDDEPIMVKMMKCLLPWEELGLEICGEAYNGQEALTYVDRYNPDIILIDIQMPLMDGIQFMEEMRRRKETCSIIVVSAYQEFEYARKAIDAGVAGYLVKPIDEDKLLELIVRLKEEKHNIRKILLSEILNSGAEEHRFKINGPFRVAVFNVDAEMNEAHVIVQQQLQSSLFHIESYIYHNQLVVLVLPNTDDPAWRERLIIEVRNLLETFGRSGIRANAGISLEHDQPSRLTQAYQEAKQAVAQSFYSKSNGVYDASETRLNSDQVQAPYSEMDEELLHAIEFNQPSSIREAICKLNEHFQSQKYNPDKVRIFCFELLLSVRRGVQRIVKQEEVLEPQLQTEEVQGQTTLEALLSFMEDKLIQSAETVHRRKQNRMEIDQVRLFLLERYREKDLSLETVARQVAMSKNHLSKIFKQQEGQGIWDYLTEIRMRKAKELLATTELKVYQIAEQVGYDNFYYFNKLFKKTFGVTPLEYKKE